MNIAKRSWFSERKIAGAVMLVSALVFALLSWTFYYKADWVVGWLRYFVIVVFTVLPAGMYYVFIASRKSSLFQEYVNNLHRLGLLCYYSNRNRSDISDKPDVDRNYINSMRVQSYILRFEGVYGPIGKTLNDGLLAAVRSTDSDSQATPVSAVTEELATGPIFSFSTAVPVLIATFLIGICWLLAIPPWVEISAANSQDALKDVLSFSQFAPLLAFLGAYFFSLQMLFRRFVTNDLRAKSYMSISMRIVMAVIGAWVLQVVFSTEVLGVEARDEWLLLFCFVVGAFPPVLWRLIREAGSRFPGIKTSIPSMDSRLPVSELDGLTIWHQTRLEEEDVENTYNMANTDIVDLLVHTKIPPERIIDWVDQAILYTVISHEDKQSYNSTKQALSKWGIRSASMLDAALSAYHSDAESDSGTQSKMFDDIGIERVSSFARSANGFTNYLLVKQWKQLAIDVNTIS